MHSLSGCCSYPRIRQPCDIVRVIIPPLRAQFRFLGSNSIRYKPSYFVSLMFNCRAFGGSQAFVDREVLGRRKPSVKNDGNRAFWVEGVASTNYSFPRHAMNAHDARLLSPHSVCVLAQSQTSVSQLLPGGLDAKFWQNQWLVGPPIIHRVDPQVRRPDPWLVDGAIYGKFWQHRSQCTIHGTSAGNTIKMMRQE